MLGNGPSFGRILGIIHMGHASRLAQLSTWRPVWGLSLFSPIGLTQTGSCGHAGMTKYSLKLYMHINFDQHYVRSKNYFIMYSIFLNVLKIMAYL